MSFRQYIKSAESFGISLDAITNKELQAAVQVQQEEALKSRQSDLVAALRTICKADDNHGSVISGYKSRIRELERAIKKQGALRDRNRIVHALFVSDNENITPSIRFGCFMLVHDPVDIRDQEAKVLSSDLGVETPFTNPHTMTGHSLGGEESKKFDAWANEVFAKAEGLLPEGVIEKLRTGSK